MLVPFYDMCEAIFANVRATSTGSNVIKQNDTEDGLFRGIEEMSKPVAVARCRELFINE